MPRAKNAALEARNAEMARRYRTGTVSLRQLAEQFDLSHQRVKEILEAAGVNVQTSLAKVRSVRHAIESLVEDAEQLRTWWAADGRARPEVFQRRLEAHVQRAREALATVA